MSKLTGISEEKILSGDRSEDVVEARTIICYILIRNNCNTKEIARFLHRTTRAINYIKNNNIDLILRKKYIVAEIQKYI